MKAVDPRPWNIFAGLCVASGCGGRVFGVDTSGSESESGDPSESTTTVDSSDGSDTDEGPECVTSVDCPDGYYCSQGECIYIPQDDDPDTADSEYNYGECTSHVDCDPFEICASSYCQDVGWPSDCPAPDPVAILTIPETSLALSFADVDDVGASELVVATQSELQVYESGSDVPLVSPRGLDSNTIDAMAGAAFDAMPGEDVVILVADELRRHASDGVGNFAAPSVSASSWPDSVGLLAGDFDGVAPADTAIWASSGAGIELGSGAVVQLSLDEIGAATARSLAEPVPGFALQSGVDLPFFDTAGTLLAVAWFWADPPYALTSIAQLGEGFDLASSVIYEQSPWTLIEQWHPVRGSRYGEWAIPGQVAAMAGGDFDGDTQADVALLVDGTVQVHFAVLGEACLALYPFAAIATSIVVGDHDGDTDDEIAIRFEAGNIAVIDGE
jgi:hypothetical protein